MNADIQKRLVIFVAVLAAALLFLAPTIAPNIVPQNWISKKIQLGLDLSGGVHLVYEVQTKEAVKNRLQQIANSIRSDLKKEKIAVTRARAGERNEIELTLLTERFVNQARKLIEENYRNLAYAETRAEGERPVLVYRISDLEAERIAAHSVSQAVETLRTRVDQFGVAEPLIQTAGRERVILQMPGVTDIESVKRVVGSVAQLEFRLLPLPGRGARVTLKDRDGGPVEVEDEVLMTGDAVETARAVLPEGQVEVSLSLTGEGAKIFRKITGENVGRNLAIILDGVVYSSPTINEAIPGGQARITGGFTSLEARELAVVLRSGALPAPLEVLEERTVGPTLGMDSIRAGVLSILGGFVFIVIFSIIYYGKSGGVAVASLALNLILVLALLSAFGATLTLPGLAGLALTIGMAVDSNVLIFERIRDELRNGSTRDAAVNLGFKNALTAIIDANVTTLITGIILYYFGSGPIRGFAVTLSIGVVTTLFCATFASRLAFDALPLRGRRGLSV